MSSLLKRVLSAAAAIVLLSTVIYFFRTGGALTFGIIALMIGAWEYEKVALAITCKNRVLGLLFLFFCFMTIVFFLYAPAHTLSLIAVSFACFTSATLWTLRGRLENALILRYLSTAAMGLLYCAALPSFALGLLLMPNGLHWFLYLLSVVFFGDIFAYFGGTWLGEEKLMPAVSPNKTLAGAASGVLGSLLASWLVGTYVLQNLPLFTIFVLGFGSAVLAQNGDLFKSLIKRVADVKDSGSIMPGHGGVLDRLDGVYFAASLIYTAALSQTQ